MYSYKAVSSFYAVLAVSMPFHCLLEFTVSLSKYDQLKDDLNKQSNLSLPKSSCKSFEFQSLIIETKKKKNKKRKSVFIVFPHLPLFLKKSLRLMPDLSQFQHLGWFAFHASSKSSQIPTTL